MKYCVTLHLRSFKDGFSIPFFTSCYYEAKSVRDLNDWLFHHVCNSDDNYEIINFLFEVVKE